MQTVSDVVNCGRIFKVMKFKLVSKFKPTGDQPQAINKLTKNVLDDIRHQVLLGVTGSGKTFTLANVIEKVQNQLW